MTEPMRFGRKPEARLTSTLAAVDRFFGSVDYCVDEFEGDEGPGHKKAPQN